MRLLAATHRNLEHHDKQQRFREDLYFRLRVMEIELPPLRERGADIAALARHMLQRTCNQLNRSTMSFHPEALQLIERYHWPGNVRELENAIERAVILSEHAELMPELLAIEPDPGAALPAEPGTIGQHLSLDAYFCRFVRENEQAIW